MFVAQQKRKENIAEYILYMYQIEDLIRAFKLDMDLIQHNLISKYKVDEKGTKEILNWYANLVIMMDKEGIREKGHLQFLDNLMADLSSFHVKLFSAEKEVDYTQKVNSAQNLLLELKQKNPDAKNSVDLAITAIYGYLLLKLQKKKISEETTAAIQKLSAWLNTLSKYYSDFEKGDFELD